MTPYAAASLLQTRPWEADDAKLAVADKLEEGAELEEAVENADWHAFEFWQTIERVLEMV